MTMIGPKNNWDNDFIPAFRGCSSLTILILQSVDGAKDDDIDTDVAAAAADGDDATQNTVAITKAFNDQNQFPVVTKIWATDDIIAELKGRYSPYDTFAEIPRPNKAAPDAKTWAGVQLWMWWLPPSAFRDSNDGVLDDRGVCKSRIITVWNTMVAGFRASKLAILPYLPPELWLHTFKFLKHDQQPAYVADSADSSAADVRL